MNFILKYLIFYISRKVAQIALKLKTSTRPQMGP